MSNHTTFRRSWLVPVIFSTTTLSMLPSAAHPQNRSNVEVLTNQSVIDMVTGKRPRDVITDKLQRTAARIDV